MDATTTTTTTTTTGGGGPALRAVDLYRFFHAGDDETLALRGVSLDVHAGELVAVTGPSGSGKSTLLACLAGLDDPDGGVVLVDGTRISRRSESERAAIRARSIGMLFQSGNLLDQLTVSQNVEVARRLAGRVDHERIGDLLDQLGIGARASALPAELSGGETARAGLAVALANDPPVLLADEPTGELDGTTAEQIMGLLRGRSGRGTAIVVVTHDPHVAAGADRRVALVDGRVSS
jgi:putative ABC transport system ATP-binding protein